MVLMGLFAIAPLSAGAMALTDGWTPTGDDALIGLRSRDAWTSKAPLVGQPTTGDQATGVESSHPGPMEYWLLGPFVRVAGPTAGLVLGGATLVAASLVTAVWLAHRNGGRVLAALLSVAMALLVRALGAASLYDTFNSEVATYPMIVLVLAVWSILLGDLAVAPVFVLAATFAAQVHVAGAAFSAVPAFVAVVAIAIAVRHRRSRAARVRHALAAAGAIVVLGWLPVAIQAMSARQSNASALVRTMTAEHPRIGAAFTLERLAAAIAPAPIFVRSTGRFGFLHDVTASRVVLAALVGGGAISLALEVRQRTRRRGPLFLALVTAGAAGASTALDMRNPPLSAFRADGTRWLWVISMLAWVTLGWAAWHLLRPSGRRTASTWCLPLAAWMCAAVLVVGLVQADVSTDRDGAVMPATKAVSVQTIAVIPPGTYHLSFDGPQALVAIGPGLALQLESAGRHVVVDVGPFSRGYGPDRERGHDRIDGALRVSTVSDAGPAPGERQIARGTIGDAGDGGAPSAVRVFLS